MVGDSGAGGTKGAVPAPAAGDAAADKYLKADATWAAPGGGAATTEPYVTIGNTAGLSAERALTAGDGIAIADGGANSTATISVDAELAAIAGLTSAADKVPYFTGSGTAAVADFTAAGRALIDDANAAAQRTTLGLGTAAVEAVDSGTWLATAAIAAGAVTAPKLATPYECHDITHTSDTALATQVSGGTQIGATLSSIVIPTSGIIRLTLLAAEFDETESSATARAGMAIDVGGTKVWGTSDTTAGTLTYRPYIQADSGATSVIWSKNYDAQGGNTVTIGTWDIVDASFPTGARDVQLYFGDNVDSQTGEITITGTTHTFRAMIEIIAYT
tara:strand:+ start:3575 stop:4570 length:996 start_codon:yes stop_codon:yes gene_type:complete